MPDAGKQAWARVAGGVVREFTPLRTWPADTAVIMSSSATYQVGGGHGADRALCAVCLDPIGMAPFSVHTMTSPEPCRHGAGHLPSVSVAIHVTCVIPGDRDLCDTIISLSATCAPW